METRAECPIVAKMLIFGEHPEIYTRLLCHNDEI